MPKRQVVVYDKYELQTEVHMQEFYKEMMATTNLATMEDLSREHSFHLVCVSQV